MSSCSFGATSSRPKVAELLPERAHRHHGLGHRPVTARAADVGEEPPREFTGVLRVPQVPHRDDQRLVDDPRDDGPLDVLELQEEVGDVGDEILAGRCPEEAAEHLVDE